MSSLDVVDIGHPPWEALSNFHPYSFSFRSIEFASMEGLLQGLKFPLSEKQLRLAQMIGIQTKRKGQKKKWWLDQILYWQGQPIDRHSSEYILLVKDAFLAMYQQNNDFRECLNKTEQKPLIHSVGKSDPRHTILTEAEFVSILTELRHQPV